MHDAAARGAVAILQQGTERDAQQVVLLHSRCPRLRKLGIQHRDLRSREAELDQCLTAQAVPANHHERIARIHDEIVATLVKGVAGPEEGLAKGLIVQVEVDGKVAYRRTCFPTAGVGTVGTWWTRGDSNH